MTIRQVWESVLIELKAKESPSLTLEEFNYFFNRGVYQTLNKKYNSFELNQQSTDDLRVLRSSCSLNMEGKKVDTYSSVAGSNYSAIYATDLPLDYFHILNCTCEFELSKNYKCYKQGHKFFYKASRLTSDSWGVITSNYYHRPTYKNPYFYITNVNSKENPNLPINTTTPNIDSLPSITIGGKNNINREVGIRYGNQVAPRIEIRYGTDNTLFELKSIIIEYLKTPQHGKLTREHIDLVEDTSQVLEFPDYMVYEIINEVVLLALENTTSPRLQTLMPTHQSIATPTLSK